MEELNAVIDSAFLCPGIEFKMVKVSKSLKHEGCSFECIDALDDEEIEKMEDSYLNQKLYQYESNP
jgi:hypothetical protein